MSSRHATPSSPSRTQLAIRPSSRGDPSNLRRPHPGARHEPPNVTRGQARKRARERRLAILAQHRAAGRRRSRHSDRNGCTRGPRARAFARSRCSRLELPHPDAERIGAALAKARGYRPARIDTQPTPQHHRTPSKPPRYFSIPAEIDLVDALDAHIGSGSDKDDDPVRKFWDVLKARSAVARRPHVTIVHSKQLPDCVELWERSAALYALPAPPLFSAHLGHVPRARNH